MSEAAASAEAHRSAFEPCDEPRPRPVDWVVAGVGLLILSDAFDTTLYRLFGWRAPLMPGVPVARLPLLAVVAAAGFLMAGELRRAADRARAVWLLWPAVALSFVSALWSARPGTTLLWSAALLGTSAFGVALAVRFSAAAQAALAAAVTAGIAAASLLAAVSWPAFAIARPGFWRGIYVHKNVLGRSMALGIAAALSVAPHVRRRALPILGALLCALVLAKTQSRAAILTTLVTVAAALLLCAARAWRQRAAVILTSGVAAMALALALLVATPGGLALLGRSDTLSDRTTIWNAVAAAAAGSPWIGQGYAAFWRGPAGREAMARVGIRLEHAHNGAVDLYAELGVVGVALVFVPLAVFAAAALRHAMTVGGAKGIWPATYLVFFVASNAAESALLRHKVFWALYVAAACCVAGRRRSRP